MKRPFDRLVFRTAGLFTVLFIASQISWIAIGGLFLFNPRQNEFVIQLATYVKLARRGLASIPATSQSAFLREVNDHSDIALVPIYPPYGEAMAPERSLPAGMLMSLRELAGDDVDARIGLGEGGGTWIRFLAGKQRYWLVIPTRHLPFPGPMLGSLATALFVSAVGAYLLISRLNRRLQVVVEASRTIGRGQIPAPIELAGPLEIQELSRCFNQMSEGIQRLDAERRLMLAGISHDLRTPLVRLRLGIELSRPELSADCADSMIREIQQIDAILTQFLQFAHDESHEPVQLIDIDSLVSDVCVAYSRRGHDVRALLGSTGIAPVREVAVRRLLANLIDNALRYGGKEVEVATSRSGEKILLSVSDRGPGIRSMEPDELLKPFAREDASRNKPGTGLGLTIVDRIARAHGGNVSLRNRRGGGLQVIASLSTDEPAISTRDPTLDTA
jgi:two-component system osmolarity sensor histidine kinase EnvZ